MITVNEAITLPIERVTRECRELFIVDRSELEQKFKAWRAKVDNLPESIKEKFPAEVMTKSFQELRPELYSDEATDESVKAEGDRIRGLMEDVNNFIKSYLEGVRQRSVQYIELREKIKK